MINLAKMPQADMYIARELAAAKATIIPFDGDPCSHEVPYTLMGALGQHILLRRGWRYWVALGPVPLSPARRMYKDPEGAKSVRAGGHGGRLSPEGNQICRYHEGKKVIYFTPSEKNQLVSLNLWDKVPEKHFVVDSEETYNDTGVPYVTVYHIDTQEGLNLYVKEMTQELEKNPQSIIYQSFPHGFTLNGNDWEPQGVSL